MNLIINLEDSVIGSWHQIVKDGDHIFVDGALMPNTFELHRRIKAVLAAWEDEFEGITDGKDEYLMEKVYK